MSCLDKVFLICFLYHGLAAKNAKDVIGFPEMEENPDLKNKENRQPVFLPSMCPANELYYPGDQKDDWICDCRPAYIYHPATDMCWPAFQRGPCLQGQYLVLPRNSVIPACETNPCYADNYVYWNGKCEKLGTTDPCMTTIPTVAALGVNATSLVVSCVRLNLENRFQEPPEDPSLLCNAGGKRSVNGKCVPK